MSEAWSWFKIGFFGGLGFIAAYGGARLLLWLLGELFGHAPKIPF